MNCRMTKGIYLKSNGEIRCYCSSGENTVLAKPPIEGNDFNFVNDFYLKGKFEHIRSTMKNNVLPYPDICLKCLYFDPYEKFEDETVESEIDWILVEPLFACNLKCPYCTQGIPKSQNRYWMEGSQILSAELYYKILEDFHGAGMKVKWMYFSGKGEPGLHPEIWNMVAKTKSLFPDTNVLVNTNGNIKYSDMIVDSGLDKIKLALDDLDQEKYARYRIDGNVDEILDVTKKIVDYKKATNSKTPEVIWQRIIFDYNDSDEEIIEYQKKAMEYEVDSLRFIYTWTDSFSAKQPEDMPIIFDDIEHHNVYKKSNMPLEEMKGKLKLVMEGDSLADTIHLITRILRWFELGIKDRNQYDDWGNLPLKDINHFFGSSDEYSKMHKRIDPLQDEYKEALKICFEKASTIYSDMGNKEESLRYAGFANGVFPAIKKLAV